MIRVERFAALVAIAAIAACAPMRAPENQEPAAPGRAYQAQYRSGEVSERDDRNRRSAAVTAERCTPADSSKRHGVGTVPQGPELLSRGDLVSVSVGKDEVFSGEFEVSRDGQLKLPHLKGVGAHGRTVEAVEKAIRSGLVSGGFYGYAPSVSVRVVDFAPARVHVQGAVFEPGPHDVGLISSDDRDSARQSALGAATEGRNLSVALRQAGGVRPDADLSRVVVQRDGTRHVADLSGALSGRAFADLMLLAGDQVIVPSRGCFVEELMVASAVTPPGVKLYLSNLTKPADANALSAIGRDAREVPWGTRFLQAVIGMNCVGGTQITNADRYAVLFSRNPMSGNSVVIERRIEDLLRRADRDDLDPYLLPGDAIACYDSTVTNITEVAKAISIVTGTGFLLAL